MNRPLLARLAVVQCVVAVGFFIAAIWGNNPYYQERFAMTGLVLAVTTIFTAAFASDF